MSNIVQKVSSTLNEKIVQVSLISAVLFFVVAHPMVFNLVDKNLRYLGSLVSLNLNFQGTGLLAVHSVVFAVLVGVTIRYVFEPLFRKQLV
jgi:hypothetical protein